MELINFLIWVGCLLTSHYLHRFDYQRIGDNAKFITYSAIEKFAFLLSVSLGSIFFSKFISELVTYKKLNNFIFFNSYWFRFLLLPITFAILYLLIHYYAFAIHKIKIQRKKPL